MQPPTMPMTTGPIWPARRREKLPLALMLSVLATVLGFALAMMFAIGVVIYGF